MRRIGLICLCFVFLLTGCSAGTRIQPIEQLTGQYDYARRINAEQQAAQPVETVEKEGMIVSERFDLPAGYTRVSGSNFGAYLQKLPLLPSGDAPVQYDGEKASMDKTAAVINLPVSSQNYENAGDSIIRLIATYLYQQGAYEKISFRIGNNFPFSFDNWRKGQLLHRVNEDFSWKDGGDISDGNENFQKYLDTLFTYATVRMLRENLKQKAAEAPVEIGDILIDETASSCSIIVDMAQDGAGNTIYLLASGSAIPQQMSILKNNAQEDGSAWYMHTDKLTTPNAVFSTQTRYVMDFS